MKEEIENYIINKMYKNIGTLPIRDSPYITPEMYLASHNSRYILAKKLRSYYSEKSDVMIEWLFYWLLDRINGIDMQINIYSCIFVPVCIGIASLMEGYKIPTLIIYFIIMIWQITKAYLKKDFYEFHYILVDREFKRRALGG